MTRGFSFFEEALLVVEAQDPNIEWYMKVAAATQNAIQCYMSSKMRKKKKNLLLRNHWIIFPRGQMELNLARNQTLCHQCQMWVNLQFALLLILLMILQLYHLLPPLAPPVSNSSCLFTWCQPLYVSCCVVVVAVSLLSFVRFFFNFMDCSLPDS